jgi:hypothetical protein
MAPPPPPPPPQAARYIRPAENVTMRKTLRVRSDAERVQIASMASSASKVRRPPTEIVEIDAIALLAAPPPFECGAGGMNAPMLRVVDDVLAVVVTVNVVPVIEQLPAGMLQSPKASASL